MLPFLKSRCFSPSDLLLRFLSQNMPTIEYLLISFPVSFVPSGTNSIHPHSSFCQISTPFFRGRALTGCLIGIFSPITCRYRLTLLHISIHSFNLLRKSFPELVFGSDRVEDQVSWKWEFFVISRGRTYQIVQFLHQVGSMLGKFSGKIFRAFLLALPCMFL